MSDDDHCLHIDITGAVLSSLASLGETLKIGDLCEGLQRFQMFQQQTGETSLKEQKQLLDMAEQHAASLTGQVSFSQSYAPGFAADAFEAKHRYGQPALLR